MGKRSKKKSRIFCCWSQTSSDSEDEGDAVTKPEKASKKVKKSSRKPTREEVLRQEYAEFEAKCNKLKESIDASVVRSEAIVKQVVKITSKSHSENAADDTAFTCILVKYGVACVEDGGKERFGDQLGDMKSWVKIDENQNLINGANRLAYPAARKPSLVKFTEAQTKASSHVSNRAGDVFRTAKEYCQPFTLRELCRQILGIEDQRNTRHGSVLGASSTVRKENTDIELTGAFGEQPILGCGLARAKRQLKEKNFLHDGGLSKIIQPLRDMQCVLHHEILTTLNFPFRITLRDLMLRNTFNEGQVQFLCYSLLTSLRHLHDLGLIHGQISPQKVGFTQFGYPYLTGFDINQTVDSQTRPHTRTRVEYTSPEQINSEPITPATDIFHTGLVVYSVFFKRSPFKAETYHKTKANLFDESFIPSFDLGTFSKDGRHFIRSLLKKEPESRFNPNRRNKPLNVDVKWFNRLHHDQILNQTFPSPFKDTLMREILAD